jgi:DNA helicase HerA-like ATPase
MTADNISQRLGIVVSGSLTKGVEVRLDGSASVEDMAVGRYVTIQGQKQRFFGMITDVTLDVVDERITQTPPDVSDPFIAEVLSGTSTYGVLHVQPYLTLGTDIKTMGEPQPVKTVPAHFAPVELASDRDMELIFGKEDTETFLIGNPLDMETKLCLNLEKFVTRSNGIFGKSGTGKTFLTRILLIGMLQKSKAVNLIFDMHNEYGWEGSSEGATRKVKGLKQWGQSRVAIFTLDKENSASRKVPTDFTVQIGYDEITAEDISVLRATLNLTDLAVEAAYQVSRRLGKSWIRQLLELNDKELEDLLKDSSIHESSLQSLKRGLRTFERLGFVVPRAPEDAVRRILSHLDRGISVVLEFGRYRDVSAYLLVANMLSRRIYAQYQERAEKARANDTPLPQPLVITIEEAHKFLNTEVANKTVFGTIAREMRKYNVSLLVIDQRPSGIDEEVMSQLGTKITCLLDNEKDIDSVLAGVSGKNELRSVLARLAPKQQALIFGHSVPMPVAFQPREYGSKESYRDFGAFSETETKKQAEKDIEDLFGEKQV